jgi:hypothetical protein
LGASPDSPNFNQYNYLKLLNWIQGLYTSAQSKLLLILHGNFHGTKLASKLWASPNGLGEEFLLIQFPSFGPIVSNLLLPLDEAHTGNVT